MLAILVVLAILLSVADTRLNVITIPVQYLQIQPNCSEYNFAPGKGLPPQYLNPTEHEPCGCVSNLGGCIGGDDLFYHSEYLRTAAEE